ncbi:hypothetical protein PICSAR7_04172 [Mycobacterium avium subsp. paratuberculosis]|nr:hypothetical protein PICSAR7_04172 [Mycobacterium avium subsp. paratuberculosis]
MFLGPCACSTDTPAAASCAAAPDTARFSEAAPCEPPNTSNTRASSANPKCRRASARSAARSSEVMASRTGTPTTSAPGRPQSGTADSTRCAVRAPTRLASPALALASWITTGTRGLRGETPRAAR